MFDLSRFRFIVAESPGMKERIYRLRYQVYVQEFQFENENNDGIETDEHDPHSIHLAITDAGDEMIGTCRIVLPSSIGFPLEKIAKISFPFDKPDREKTVEAGRLALNKKFRRRKEDGFSGVESYLYKSEGGILPSGRPQNEQRRERPIFVMALYKFIYQMCKKFSYTHVMMLIEAKLFFALTDMGWLLYPIGDPVQHRGERRPYVIAIPDSEFRWKTSFPHFLDFYTDGLAIQSR